MSQIAYFLLTHPNPNLRNYSNPRRNKAKNSGVVVLHTGENATDMIGVDSGAESVARYLSTRTTYGSYHVLVDSDSTVPVLPPEYEAYHCIYTNNHSYGISAGIQLRHWDTMPKDRRDAILRRMAEAAADYAKWLKRERGIEIPARWLTRAEALAGVPGFIEHGRTDPWRRSDPWDRDSDEAADFMRYYIGALGGGGVGTAPVVVPKPEPVKNSRAARAYKPGEVARIQTILAALDYYHGAIDDDYGDWTYRGVLAYQRAQEFGGLRKDGDWGPTTEAHYQWVLTLQRTLNEWKGADIRVDGDYGPATDARVWDVMRRNHGGSYPSWAKLDGVPGPVFCAMLNIPVHP